MTSSVSQASRMQFQKFQEDFAQLTSQKSRIPCFRPDGPIIHPDVLQCLEDSDKLSVASIRTSGQHFRALYKVRDDSSFPLQTRIGKDSLQPSGR
jgi:hypothetical protein